MRKDKGRWAPFERSGMAKRPDWFYRQSAVLPYRVSYGVPDVLLITSRKRKRWILPKGVVEPDLTPLESAVKEALEEAGIEGDVSPNGLGTYSYEKWGGVCTVEVFLMAVRTEFENWPEATFRRRDWMSFEVAAERVDEAELKKLILGLPEVIRIGD